MLRPGSCFVAADICDVRFLCTADTRATDKPSIAVLPFANLSGDPEQDYFADGITEDIITDLSKVSGLSVLSRNAVFGYKDKNIELLEMGRRLSANIIVEGSVRRIGQRVRINAKLIDAKNHTSIWADRYDRELTDIFAIQDDITKMIVEQLTINLLPKEKEAIEATPTQNIEAYNYYLQGRHFYHYLTISHARLAQRLFRKAIELDPAYARAYAGLADCAWHLYLNPEPETSVQDILEASTKAIQLDPELAEARASYGLALHYSGQHEKAVIEFERAIELNPNLFEVYYNYSTVLRDAGNREAAAKMLARATEIAPDDFRTPFGLSHMCHDLGQLSQAKEAARIGLERAERALVEHPEVGLPAAIGAVALARLGERATAFEWASRALVIAPDDPLTRYNVACAYSLLGEPDRAIEMLEPWGTANAAMRSWVMKDTDLDSIRNHPRFEKLFNPVVARN